MTPSKPRLFGAAIRHFREQANITKKELQRRARISNDTMFRAEAGQNIGIEQLGRIADALGVPLARLFMPLTDPRPWWESPEIGHLLRVWTQLEPHDRALILDVVHRVLALYQRQQPPEKRAPASASCAASQGGTPSTTPSG